MEVAGKTIKDVLRTLLQKINENIITINELEEFNTKFDVKGKNVEEAIEKFSAKIIDYFNKKNAVFENLDVKIIPGKKWIFSCYLNGKKFERIKKNFEDVKIVRLEESIDGWRLYFSLE